MLATISVTSPMRCLRWRRPYTRVDAPCHVHRQPRRRSSRDGRAFGGEVLSALRWAVARGVNSAPHWKRLAAATPASATIEDPVWSNLHPYVTSQASAAERQLRTVAPSRWNGEVRPQSRPSSRIGLWLFLTHNERRAGRLMCMR